MSAEIIQTMHKRYIQAAIETYSAIRPTIGGPNKNPMKEIV